MAPQPPPDRNKRALWGVLFLAAVDGAYNAYGAINSSPQTTELFAAERETTLMKYVRIADVTALALGALGSFISRNIWPFVGTALVVGMMHSLYRYAVKCAKRNRPTADRRVAIQ